MGNGQDKYFEKTYTLADDNINHQGYRILLNNDNTYKLYSAAIDNGNWYSTVLNADLEGNLYDIKEYKLTPSDPDYTLSLQGLDACVGNENYAIAGRSESYDTLGQNYSTNGFLLTVDETCDSLNLFLFDQGGIDREFYCVAPTADNGFMLAGSANYGAGETPYFLRVDSNGEFVFEANFLEFSSDMEKGRFSAIASIENGGFVLVGTPNYSAEPADRDAFLVEISADGEISNSQLIDFGHSDSAMDIKQTSDGGFILAMHKGNEVAMPTSDLEGVGVMVKYNSDLAYEWEIEICNNQTTQAVIELADNKFAICGSHEYEDGEIDLTIAKVAIIDNEPILQWRRFYGDDGVDNAFDIIASPDDSNGFTMIGRSDSTDINHLYLIKTNCMGLINLPEANFEVEMNELTAAFNNVSQYVYPDSIDGGQYLWDFGDGNTSTAINPTHTFAEGGIYDVTLTAIVCDDTSIFTQTINTLTDIQNISNANIQLYPNPANDILQIQQTDHQTYDYELFNSKGQLIDKGQLNQDQNSLNTKDFYNGIYFLQLRNEHYSMTQRIVIQH